MNFKSLVNEICCDNRIKNGVLDLKNEDHVFILQEYLEKAGYNIDEIVEKTAKLFEAGRFPDRQAYNKDGILVTFPNKQYRDRAVNKGTHFAENPKKAQANIFKADGEQGTDAQADSEPSDKEPATLDQTLDKDIEGDSGVDKRTPAEKKQDAWGVEAILTGQTPLVNYSVDEAKSYGFYNKGFKWFDTNGDLIGEQIYDENISKVLIKAKNEANLSALTTKALKKINVLHSEFAEILQILKTGAVEGKDDAFKTDLYETLPLLVLYDIYNLSNAKSLGGDSVPRAVDFFAKVGNFKSTLEKISDPIKKSENLQIYDAVVKSLYEIGGMGGVSLKNITSKSPTEFIHNSIGEFYAHAKTYDNKFSGGEKNKKNTADVVIIYGGTKNDVYAALDSGSIEDVSDSVSKIKGKDIYFALVSLKAMSGRVGKVLTQLRGYLEAEVETQPSGEYQKIVKETRLTEGFFTRIKNTFDSYINKYKEISDTIKEKYRGMIDDFSKLTGGFIDKVKKDLFDNLNGEVKNIETHSLKELKKIEDKITQEIGSLNEKSNKSCGTKSTDLSPALLKNLEDYEKLLSVNNTDDVILNKIVETAKNPTVSKYFIFDVNPEELSQVKSIKQNIKSTIKKLSSSKQTCISRDELAPVLIYRGNALALQYIDLIMKKVLQDTNLSDPDKIQKEFINLASILSTEAIFGGNVSLPLIKFTGDKLERLGYKNQYKVTIPEKIPDLKLGKLTVRLEPEANAYLVIYLYLFFGIETEDDQVTPIYVVYEMRSESGSGFSFKVEGNKFVNKI